MTCQVVIVRVGDHKDGCQGYHDYVEIELALSQLAYLPLVDVRDGHGKVTHQVLFVGG